jgi:hypothetical protein
MDRSSAVGGVTSPGTTTSLSTSTAASPNSRHSNLCSSSSSSSNNNNNNNNNHHHPNINTKIHMSDNHNNHNMKIGPAAVAAAIADASPSAQLLKMSDVPILRQHRHRGLTPEEMREKDPLAADFWRLWRSTVTFLPESVRMENMTWRMMSMTLKRKEQQR